MAIPVASIPARTDKEQWQEIENESCILITMTEDTLTTAKETADRNSKTKQRSSRMLSIVSLTGTFLLLFIWLGFLYHTGHHTLVHKINTYFEVPAGLILVFLLKIPIHSNTIFLSKNSYQQTLKQDFRNCFYFPLSDFISFSFSGKIIKNDMNSII